MKRAARFFAWFFALGGFAALLSILPSTFLPSPARAQRYESSPADTAHPRIVYADSMISLNDRCAVRQTKLSRMRKPVYVNLHPVGFC